MTRERRRIALILTAVLAVGLFGHCRGSGYRNFFGHDPRESHDYALDRRDGTTWEVSLGRDGFDWPDDAPRRNVTALLEFRARTRPLLPSLSPSVEFRADGRSYTQSFAPRSTGRR